MKRNDMNNVFIINWKTGKRYDNEDAITALKDIINNNSKDYSFNYGMAERTVEAYQLNLEK